MNNDRQMKRIWVFLIVSAFMGFAFTLFFFIQMHKYKKLSKDVKDHLKNTAMEMLSQNALKKEAKIFLKKNLPKIFKSWSSENYLALMDKNRYSSQERGAMLLLFESVATNYGPLVRYISAQGNIKLRGTSIRDVFIYGEYTVTILFKNKKKPVSFLVSIFKDIKKRRWFLENFHGL